MDFCKIPEQPSQDTWSHVSCVLCTDAPYSHTWAALSADTESSVPWGSHPPPLPAGLGMSYSLPRGSVVSKAEYIFTCFPSRCYRGVSVQQLTLLRPPQLTLFPPPHLVYGIFLSQGTQAGLMLIPCSVPHSKQPQWCRTQWQVRCSDPLLPTSPWVEQWFAQRGLPVIQSPGKHAQGFFQKLCQSSLQRYHTLRESRSLKLSESI